MGFSWVSNVRREHLCPNSGPALPLITCILPSLRSSDSALVQKTVVDFQDDLTVLVGENNGGKSNIIDAIRLLTLPLNGRRERYPENEDLRRGATVPHFQFVGEFAGLSDTLKGLLITAVPDATKDKAVLGYRYVVAISPIDTSNLGQSTIRLNATVNGEPRIFVLVAGVK